MRRLCRFLGSRHWLLLPGLKQELRQPGKAVHYRAVIGCMAAFVPQKEALLNDSPLNGAQGVFQDLVKQVVHSRP